MCLIAWNWQPASGTPLLLLANRDEFYARATQPLHWWEGDTILAGKDLQAGGTWLGANRDGRLGALTNYRTGAAPNPNAPSRGELVADFLASNLSAAHYLQRLSVECHRYNPFNLLLYDGLHLMGLESRSARVLTFGPGVGAVSNADFDTPWPKLERLKEALQRQQGLPKLSSSELLALLHDRSLAADGSLPSTGVPLELERVLSATFIATPNYGTRACTLVAIHQRELYFTEQSHGARGVLGQVEHRLSL